MIQVSRTRFFEIFADNKYKSQVQKGPWEYSSCPYYDVIDTETNIIVGVYSDGSWENTFEVLPVYASKNDIIEHYERLLKHKNDELERTRKSWRKLQDYKNLSVEDRALQDKKEEEEREWRKTHPSLYQFIDSGNMIPYSYKDFGIEEFLEMFKITDSKILNKHI